MKSSHRFDPKLSQREMLEASRLGAGKRVKVKHHHREAKDGEHGEIRSVHHGTFYGVGFEVGGPVAYVPADDCDPVDSDDSGSSSEGGTTSTASGAAGGTGTGAGAGPAPAVTSL